MYFDLTPERMWSIYTDALSDACLLLVMMRDGGYTVM
jgi:hypothetical protein